MSKKLSLSNGVPRLKPELGAKNYVGEDSRDFENGVGDWETDNGSGSAANYITLSRNTTTPLAGNADLSFTKSANNASGEYAKLVSKTIDRADRGRTLFGYFSMDCTDSNYASGDLILEVVDQNGDVLYSGQSEDLELLATEDRFNYVVYTDSNTTSVEIRIKINSTNATAYTVYFDDFKLGPAAQVNTVYRKSQTIDLTGSGDFTGGEIQVERVGNIVTVAITGSITYSSSSGAVSASGVLPDWARPDSNTQRDVTNASGSAVYLIDITTAGTINISSYNWAGSLTNTTTMNRGSITYTVPDTTGPTLTENELSLQTVEAVALDQNPTGTLGATWNTMVFGTLESNSHGAYNTTTGQFTAPRTGTIDVSGFIEITFTAASGRTTGIRVANTTQSKNATGSIVMSGSSNTGRAAVSGSLKVNKGDIVEVQSLTNGSSPSYSSSFGGSSFSIRYRPDYTVLGAVRNFETHTATISADQDITSDGVEEDITDMSHTLGPGTWKLEYSGGVRIQKLSNAGQLYARIRITDGSNTVVKGSESLIGRSSISASESQYGTMSGHAVVTITSETTYKVRGEFTDNGSSGGGLLRIVESGFAFSGEDDSGFAFTATRLK